MMNLRLKKFQESKDKILNTKGISFIETTIVIVIVGILAATAIPKIGSIPSEKASLEGASLMIASDIRYTQELAMVTGTSKRIVFSTSNPNSYTFSPSSQYDPSGRLPSGISISKNLTIKFNSLGEPTFEVGDGSLIISGIEGTKTISVENYTGKVTLN